MTTVQIVLAWKTETALVATGRTITRDLNYFPEFKAAWEGKAVMWARKGSSADMLRAQKHAEFEGKSLGAVMHVFTFPSNERDPLGKAREKVLEMPHEPIRGQWD